MAEVTVEGRRVCYECPRDLVQEQPRGQVVLLVHGACDNRDYWRHQMPVLAAAHTPITVDLPGRRGSEGPPHVSAAGYLAFFEALAAALELPPFVFCGHSVGGSMALDYAIHHPGRVKALILVGSGPSWPPFEPHLDLWRMDPDRAFRENLAELFSPRTPPSVRDAYDGQLRTTPPATCRADLETCATFDLEMRLGRVTAPALVLCGRDETWIDGSRTLAARLPNATTEYVADAGHAVALEQPEPVNAAIGAFLDRLA